MDEHLGYEKAPETLAQTLEQNFQSKKVKQFGKSINMEVSDGMIHLGIEISNKTSKDISR